MKLKKLTFGICSDMLDDAHVLVISSTAFSINIFLSVDLTFFPKNKL